MVAPAAPWLLWLLLLGLAAWAYFPGLSGPPLLDDSANLRPLELLLERPDLAADVISGNQSGAFGRPVAMASFVLDTLVWGTDLYIYKRSNLVLHLLCATLIAWLFARLLYVARMPFATWLATLGAGLWLLSPLLLSTVLYTVQRMTILSCLGLVAALLVYVEWRVALLAGRARHWLLFFYLPCAAFAVFAKENGILVLPLTLALELYWFNGRDGRGQPIVWLQRCSFALVVASLAVAVLLFFWLWGGVKTAYDQRDFSLAERLLTETRILWDYVAQLLWPQLSRMGLMQDDYPLSRSVFAPAVTAIALGAWALVIAFCLAALVLKSTAVRLLAFGPVWFLLTHVLESTLLPLELYFEHRNYTPAVGVFLLIITAGGLLLRRLPEIAAPLVTGAIVLLVLLGAGLSSQASLWSSRPLIVLAAVNAHPDSSRANLEVARLYAEYGALEQAQAFAKRANNSGDSLASLHLLTLHCMANTPLPEAVIAQLTLTPEAAARRDVNGAIKTLFDLYRADACPAVDAAAVADRFADQVLASGSPLAATTGIFQLLAQLENHLGRLQRAYEYTALLLLRTPGNIDGMIMQMYFTAALQKTTEHEVLRERLQALEAAGELTIQQQYNLSLFKG